MAFMLILVIILLTFTIGVATINSNYKAQVKYLNDKLRLGIEYKDLINPRFENNFFDALYSQWLLGLGEFEMLGSTDDAEDSY